MNHNITFCQQLVHTFGIVEGIVDYEGSNDTNIGIGTTVGIAV
jgi:hypothetical protein